MGIAAALVSPFGLPYPIGGRRRGSDAAQSVRLASRVRKGRRFTSLVRKWAARPMTTAVATRRVRITAKKWNRARDVPGSCGDSANGHPAPSFEGSANGSDAAGAIRARRAACERGWGVGSAVQPRPRANFMGSRICFPGTSPLVPKGAHLSRGTPLSLGWRAVSLPQAPAAKSRLTGLLPLFGG